MDPAEMPKVLLTDDQWAWLKENEKDRTNDMLRTSAHQRAAMDKMVEAVSNPAYVMSVRDQIALSTLNGLLASGEWQNGAHDVSAHIAYRFADAMIAAGSVK